MTHGAAALAALAALALAAAGQGAQQDALAQPVSLGGPYTWTDLVVITIRAPDWNTSPHSIDSIGGSEDRAVRVSTGKGSIGPYRLAETGPDTGVFRGEVRLTGFAFDADGDGRPDTAPRTGGSGPSGGLLEAGHDDAVTVSFEYSEGTVFLESAPVSWSEGSISARIEAGHVLVDVWDPDMDLDPRAADTVMVRVTSGSDLAGVSARATETSESSGAFVASVPLGGRLAGEIEASYADRTLPAPAQLGSRLDLVARAVRPHAMPLELSAPLVSQERGGVPHPGEQAWISGIVGNPGPAEQRFAYVAQVRDASGAVVHIGWVTASVQAGSSVTAAVPWVPGGAGDHLVETFVWAHDFALALSEPASAPARVGR
ncbi:MAG: hypothetical protein MPJ06_05455 [Nitrosopumilus sp.]|nr:hypothetical protein [Nitrosopumilus sp.]